MVSSLKRLIKNLRSVLVVEEMIPAKFLFSNHQFLILADTQKSSIKTQLQAISLKSHSDWTRII
jgi:hypothetical protein